MDNIYSYWGEYLIIGGGEIKLVEAKVQSILDWPIPKSKKQVQSFLGVCESVT